MAGKALNVRIQIDGADQLLRAFRELPKDATEELRVKSLEISQWMAKQATSAGRAEGRQAALVAGTVKARRDRVPVVIAGGAKRLGRNKAPAGKLLFGSEFGSNRLKQYKRHIGRGSYWFFKSVEDNQADIEKKWLEAAVEIIERFHS